MNFGSIILDSLRSVLWFFCSAFLGLLDAFYDIIMEVAVLNLEHFPWIWSWVQGLLAVLTFFIFLRVFSMYTKVLIEGAEGGEVIDPAAVLIRVFVLAVIILLIPSFMTFFSSFTSAMISNISLFLGGGDTSARISNVIASAGFNGDFSSIDYLTLNINEKVNGTYLYYTSALDFLFVFAATVIAAALLGFVGIQIGQRLFSLIFKILLLPWIASTFIDPKDDTFSRWKKLCIGDFLTSFAQILMIILAMTFCNGAEFSAYAKVILFIGALMAVMNTPTGIAQLLGGDVGTGTAFQQMQSMMMLSGGLKAAGSLAAGAMVTSGAAGIYGIGRGLGGKSMLNAVNRTLSGKNSGSSGFQDTSEGFTGGSIGAESSEAAGGSGRSTISETSPFFQDSSGTESLAKPGSRASKVAAAAENASGVKGAVGRVGVMAARNAYKKSGEHLSRGKMVRRGGGMAQRQSRFVTASHAAHDTADAVKERKMKKNAISESKEF